MLLRWPQLLFGMVVIRTLSSFEQLVSTLAAYALMDFKNLIYADGPAQIWKLHVSELGAVHPGTGGNRGRAVIYWGLRRAGARPVLLHIFLVAILL